MKMKNIALALMIVGFAVGFSDLQENMWFWLGRPVGAIFAIVYFLFVLLEKQFAEFDREATASVKVSKGKSESSTAGLRTAVS